ncbi:hypothetical protein GN244_ATG05566 [Phytophthora infestans]|uniref:Uncharacterized protein n=1 Tax=Phytophthora infestans TaxID=4787 RepID=A0A833WHI9_PHYIN|nr:hypothetical protein GN244_ATG05566 [Phytophthora infestans]
METNTAQHDEGGQDGRRTESGTVVSFVTAKGDMTTRRYAGDQHGGRTDVGMMGDDMADTARPTVMTR